MGESKKVQFRSLASWALVFPFSDKVQEKKIEHLRVRLEVVHRLKAANLEVACLVNSAHTQVHVILSAGLERLEAEAEKAGLKKAVRCNGGLAPFSCKKRHLFGPLVLDETRFFSSGERQDLIMRAIISNPRFAGAGVDLDALCGHYTAKTLHELPPGKLSMISSLLSGGEPQGGLTHRSSDARNDMVETVLGYMKNGPFVVDVLPMHDGRAQEELAQAFSSNWLLFPPDLDRGNKSSLLDILQQSQADPRAAMTMVSVVPVVDALRDYLGEAHAIYFQWLGDLSQQLVPLVVISVVLFAMNNSTAPLHIETAVLGILAMMWINKYALQWRRSAAHLQHRWGHSREAREMAALSLRSACAQDREMERYQALTADNVRKRKATRRDRAIVQLLVLGVLGICCIAIYLAVRWSRSYFFGEPTTASQVLAMSLLDVVRIYLMQNIGREVLNILSMWDDDIANEEDRKTWQIGKYLFFELCNNFCSLAISVGYQAFSEGTDWQFVEPPSCFDKFCQYDLEIHIWSIVGIKYFFIPLVVSLYNYFTYTMLRARLRKKRMMGANASHDIGNARKGAQAPQKQGARSLAQPTTTVDPVTGKTVVVQPLRRGIMALLLGRGGPPLPITLEYDSEGLYGETPLEAQQLLKPYDPYVWELRRPLDLTMLIAFVGLFSTLSPLLPLAGLVFICTKTRLDALELIVTTQRPPCNHNRDMVIWVEAIGWVSLLSIFCTSIAIMFATPDVDALIG